MSSVEPSLGKISIRFLAQEEPADYVERERVQGAINNAGNSKANVVVVTLRQTNPGFSLDMVKSSFPLLESRDLELRGGFGGVQSQVRGLTVPPRHSEWTSARTAFLSTQPNGSQLRELFSGCLTTSRVSL